MEILKTDSTMLPKLFAKGIVSTLSTEWSTCFSPNQQTVYTSRGAVYWTIILSKLVNGKWQEPQVDSGEGRVTPAI